jgi:hypothetical protein
MDDLKLLVRSEGDWENGIKIVKANSKGVNLNFGLENCARMCLKMVRPKANFIWDGNLRSTLKN